MKQKGIIITLLALIVSITSLTAQTRQTREEYIDRYKKIAIDHMEKYGIPASITMAQGILESDCGNSQLSRESNNHFGIKCKSDWKGRKVYHDDDAKGECFRAYKSVEASYEDHALFLDNSPRYDSLFSYSNTDYKSWAHGLKAAGYATAPTYATMLIKIIEDEKLYLLDGKKGADRYANRYKDSDKAASGKAPNAGAFDPDNIGVTINAHKGYNVGRCNGVYYTEAKAGDSLKSIGETFEISHRNLRRFNDMERKVTLTAGERVYIERKESKWGQKDQRTHQVSKGETMRSISQQYGIRLSRLSRMNKIKMKDSDHIQVNQILKIR
ncbi:MAG: glucosaminidase domain-containing protein [Rikenellaceae bacterium]